MRDERRIDKILEEIRRVWKKHPDFRLIQVLYLAVSDYDFHTEDEELLDALKKW